METCLVPSGCESTGRHTLPQEYAISISLKDFRHTYGEAVRGSVVLKLPEAIGLELLEMKFTGVCGTGIKYPSLDQNASTKLTEEKSLFTHTQTLISQRQAKAGSHKFPFAFRFPRRDEVILAPSIEPLTSDNFFYFRYQITATATILDDKGQWRTLNASRTPDFMSSKDGVAEQPDDFTRIAVPAEPQHFVKNTVLGRRHSSISVDGTQERIIASLLSPRCLPTSDDMSMPISLQMEDTKRHRTARQARLTKITLYLRSRVRLTAQGQSITLNSVNQPIQIASVNLRKSSPLVNLVQGEEVSLDCKFPLRAPHYLRSSFVNSLIAYEYLLKVKAEFDINGRHYIARFDHIPVVLLPAFTQPNHDVYDYAASPPELVDDYADDFFGSPASSVPSTPPPQFSEFADEEVERRFRTCLRQDSTSSSMSSYSLWDIPADPPKYEAA